MYNLIDGMNYPDSETEFEKSRRLRDIELKEVSLVTKAANKKKFLFYKSADGDGDELNSLLSILDSAQFDSESDKSICKAVDVLTNLEDDERTAIAKTIIAIVKLAGVDIDDNTPVQKIDISDLRWPSFSSGIRVAKSESEEKPVMTGKRAQESLNATFGSVHQDESEDNDD